MKKLLMTFLVTLMTAQVASASCSGIIYAFKKVKKDKLVLHSMQSGSFSGEAECITTDSSWKLTCINLIESNNKLVVTVDDKAVGTLVDANQLILPSDKGNLDMYLGRDLRSGRHELAALIDLKNSEDDVIAVGVSCK